MSIRDEINQWIRSINPEGYDICYNKAYKKIKSEVETFHTCPSINMFSESTQILIITYDIDYQQIYKNLHPKKTT